MKRSSIQPQGAAVMLAGLMMSLSLSVQAGLVPYGVDAYAEARVVQVDSTGTHTTQDRQLQGMGCLGSPFGCTLLGGSDPLALASAVPNGTQHVHAAQDIFGAFGQRQTLGLSNYGAGVVSVGGGSLTEYIIEVGADAFNTPLMVDFRWVEGRVAAGTYYGYGLLEAWSRVQILVSRNGGPEQLVWGFEDSIHKDPAASNNLFTDQRQDTDAMGIGTPTRSFESAWRDFMVWGEVQRDAFFGTLDFGVLQPGESFSLKYRAEAGATMSGVPYAARAELLLNDPLTLGAGGPLIGIRGLDLRALLLPADPTAVPEPGGQALTMLALLGLIGRPQCGVRRRGGARASASPSLAAG